MDTEQAIVSTFSLEHLQLKKDRAWRFRILVQAPVPLMFRNLLVRLSLDESPYEERITDVEKRKEEIDSEASLFKDEKKKQLSDCDKQIAAIKKELEKARDAYDTMEFAAAVEEMKYTDRNFTMLTMIVAESDVAPLIKNHSQFRHYKVEIERSSL